MDSISEKLVASAHKSSMVNIGFIFFPIHGTTTIHCFADEKVFDKTDPSSKNFISDTPKLPLHHPLSAKQVQTFPPENDAGDIHVHPGVNVLYLCRG
jgi:hypothetical protein